MVAILEAVSIREQVPNCISHNVRTYKLNDIDKDTKQLTGTFTVIAAPNLKAALKAAGNTPVIVTFDGYNRFFGGFNQLGELMLESEGGVLTGAQSPSFKYLSTLFQPTNQ